MAADDARRRNPAQRARRAAIGLSLGLAAASTLARAQVPRWRRAAEAPARAHSAGERRILETLAEVGRNERYLSVPEEDGRLLRVLAESTGARAAVELGTSTGYSGLWLMLALSRTGGRLTSFEIDPGRHAAARRNFARAGVAAQATLVLGDAHAGVRRLSAPLDMVFIDADKDGYLDYLKKLLPLVRGGGLVVAHNMASPPPDPRYVEAVTTNPALETVFLNMDGAGVGVTLKKRA